MRIITEEEASYVLSIKGSYRIIKVLGRRNGSITLKTLNKKSESLMVVKIEYFENYDKDLISANLSKLKAMKKLFFKHPHIVIQDCHIISENFLLSERPFFPQTLFEKIRYTISSVSQYLLRVNRCTMSLVTSDRLWLAYQILATLDDIHSNDCSHGFITLDSIFVDESNWIRVTDFGISLSNIDDHTWNWRDRAILEESKALKIDRISRKQQSDIFSLGAVLFSIFTGIVPQNDQFYIDLNLIINLPADNYHFIERLMPTIMSMRSSNPDERPKLKNILDSCREEVFPGVFYSYLHSYISLLPLFSLDQGRENLEQTVSIIFNDLDDIILMTKDTISSTNYLIEHILLFLLKSQIDAKSKGKCFKALKTLIAEYDSPNLMVVIPYILDGWNKYSPSLKLQILEKTYLWIQEADQKYALILAMTIFDVLRIEQSPEIVHKSGLVLSHLISSTQHQHQLTEENILNTSRIEELKLDISLWLKNYYPKTFKYQGCVEYIPPLELARLYKYNLHNPSDKRLCLGHFLSYRNVGPELQTIVDIISDEVSSHDADVYFRIIKEFSTIQSCSQKVLALCRSALLHPKPTIRKMAKECVDISQLSSNWTVPISEDYFNLVIHLQSKSGPLRNSNGELQKVVNDILSESNPISDEQKSRCLALFIMSDARNLSFLRKNETSNFLNITV